MRASLWMVLLLLTAGVLHAADSPYRRWEVAPSANLESRQAQLQVSYESKVVTVDASIVIEGDAQRVWKTSLDYDRYVALGMPNLLASHVVEELADRNLIYTWSHLSIAGQHSQAFLEVHHDHPLGGIEWVQIPAHPGWKDADNSAFSTFGGSLYILPLSTNTMYVRYFLQGKLTTWLPDWLIGGTVRSELDKGVRGILSILAREAKLLQ